MELMCFAFNVLWSDFFFFFSVDGFSIQGSF